MTIKPRDEEYLRIAACIAETSKALNRKIGAVLVRDHTILSTGYNGPPRGIDEVNSLFHFTKNERLQIYTNYIARLLNLAVLAPTDILKSKPFKAELQSALQKLLPAVLTEENEHFHPVNLLPPLFAELASAIAKFSCFKFPEAKVINSKLAESHSIENYRDPRYYFLNGLDPQKNMHGVLLKHQIDVHAELNCIINAARNGVSTLGSTLYVTSGTPCKDCTRAIINAGISTLFCLGGIETSDNEYNYLMSVNLLSLAGIEVLYHHSA